MLLLHVQADQGFIDSSLATAEHDRKKKSHQQHAYCLVHLVLRRIFIPGRKAVMERNAHPFSKCGIVPNFCIGNCLRPPCRASFPAVPASPREISRAISRRAIDAAPSHLWIE